MQEHERGDNGLVPNGDITYDSGLATFGFQYSTIVTADMIANENAVMSRNNSTEWGMCLGCAILDAGGLDVPDHCEACFERSCT